MRGTSTDRTVDGPPQRLGWRQYVGYGLGDLANNLSFSMVTMFLVLYYTDVVQITPGKVATLILIVRAWDAVADLFAGQLVDRTMTRYGKFRPYILYCTVPLMLVTVLCFTVPGFLAPGGRLAWAYLTYAGVGLLYSLVNIPYGSLAAAMTQEPDERARLASARTIGSAVALLVITVAISNRVEAHRGDRAALQEALTTGTIIFAVIAAALYAVLFVTSREQVARATERVSLHQSFSVLLHNRPLAILCLASLAFQGALYVAQALAIYYARDVLGNANLMTMLGLVAGAGIALDTVLVGWVVRRFGKKAGYLGFGLVAVTGAVLLFLAPPDQVWLVSAAWFVCQAGLFGVSMLMWALEADTVEYGEWRMGFRTEGITYAMFSFTRKLGQAVGGALGVALLGWFGYVAEVSQQSDEALRGIRVGIALVPAGMLGVALLIMLTYPLTDQRFREIVTETARRRGGADREQSYPPIIQSDVG